MSGEYGAEIQPYRSSLLLLLLFSCHCLVHATRVNYLCLPSEEGWSNWLAQMLLGRRRLLLVCASLVLLSLLGPSNGASNSTGNNLGESRNRTSSHPLEVN
jgi:hypothetical protein